MKMWRIQKHSKVLNCARRSGSLGWSQKIHLLMEHSHCVRVLHHAKVKLCRGNCAVHKYQLCYSGWMKRAVEEQLRNETFMRSAPAWCSATFLSDCFKGLCCRFGRRTQASAHGRLISAFEMMPCFYFVVELKAPHIQHGDVLLSALYHVWDGHKTCAAFTFLLSPVWCFLVITA